MSASTRSITSSAGLEPSKIPQIFDNFLFSFLPRLNLPRVRVFEDIKSSVNDMVNSIDRILTTSYHDSLLEAIIADLFDVVPILGDVGNEERVADALRRNDRVAMRAQTLDLFFGILPVLGDVADLLTPTNTLLYLRRKDVINWDPPLPPIPKIFVQNTK